jgi:flagellar biosynthesis/type III secretory pathway protein FliH
MAGEVLLSISREGLAEGLAQGRAEGLAKGKVETARKKPVNIPVCPRRKSQSCRVLGYLQQTESFQNFSF